MLQNFDLELYKLLIATTQNKSTSLKHGNRVMYLTGNILFYLFYIIFIIYTSTMLLSMEMDLCINTVGFNVFRFIMVSNIIPNNSIVDVNIKLLYIILVIIGTLNYQLSITRNKPSSPLNFVFGRFNKRSSKYACIASLWYFLLNFLLITLVNPGLLNPGPNSLSVYYQNVQGLIPFSSLADLDFRA